MYIRMYSLLIKLIPAAFGILILLPAFNKPLYSSGIVTIDRIKEYYSLAPHLQLLEDRRGEYKIDDILSGPLSEKFSEAGINKLNYGFSSSVFWVRFKIKNEYYINREMYLNTGFPATSDASLYIYDSLGRYIEKEFSLSRPFGDREVEYRNFIFKMEINKPDTYTCYLRLRSDNAIVINPVLSWESYFNRVARIENLLFGIMIGLIVVIMFYSTVQAVYLKDFVYIYFILYLLGFGMYELTFTGLGFEYLWPDSPVVNSIFLSFFIFFTTVWGLTFTGKFMQVEEYYPVLDKFYRILVFLNVALMIISIFYYKQLIILIGNMMVMLTILIVVTSSILLWMKGSRTAKYFLAGFIFLLAGVTAHLLRNFGLLPNSLITDYSMEFGTMMLMSAIALAFSERYNIIRNENVIARDQLIETHRSAVKFLEKVDKIKTDFLVNSSKEIRVPIEEINKISRDLDEDPLRILNEDFKHKIQMITSRSKNLINQVNQIIDSSTMRITDIKLYRKSIDLKEISNLVLFFSRAQTADMGIELINEIPDNIPPVYGDENRMMQILFNLIDNAVKYSVKGNIIISAREVNEQVEVIVTDRSAWIPEKELVNIFEDYFFLDKLPIQAVDGRGFEISITRKLVELHGGTLKIVSGDYAGTEFIFSCPVYLESASKLENNRSEITGIEYKQESYIPDDGNINQKISSFDPGGIISDKSIILVVDDEPVNIQVLVNQLSLVGYYIITASDGYRALEIINSRDKPDLVLLDIMLPGISGYDVCRKIREKHTLYSLPVVMLTVKNQVKDMVAGFEAGANDYLTKPFDKMELLARVATLLTLKKIVFNYEELRFRELQKRMNPHFLFNALHSIHSLLSKKPEMADRGVIMLADIYRFLMDRSFEKQVPIELEWKFVNDYLEMERLRFPDTLSFEMHKYGDFENVSIPPLSIQPLVENSIKHGIRNKTGAGHISISAERSGSHVKIIVKDDGVGINKEDVYSRTIGNIKHRLQYYFEESNLTLKNRQEGGAEALMFFKLNI